MRWLSTLSVLALIATGGCKSVDDYMVDLETVDPVETDALEFDRSALIFDAGQLAHEALAGLSVAEEMRYWQAIRGLHHACQILGRARDNALLQADAAVLIGRLSSAMPIPPVTRRLRVEEDNVPVAIASVEKLVEARKPLRFPADIAGLESEDAVAQLDALTRLKKATGEDFGRDAEAWRAWYESVKDEKIAEFLRASRKPLEEIGSLRYKSASEARGVLKLLSLWVRDYAHPDLEDVYRPAVLTVARQAVVLSLKEAVVRNRDPQVRADVADAMALVRDVEFGEPLLAALQRERDAQAATKMIRALRFYPGRETIERIIDAMSLDEPQVSANAGETLATITEQDLGPDQSAWTEWWAEEGERLWP